MLVQKADLLREHLLTHDTYFPFPKASWREAWEKIPVDVKDSIIKVARENINFVWPSIPAVRYMDFTRNGNRIDFEKYYFHRRKMLAIFAAAECLEYQGRFIEDIINGIWLLCEETNWVLPAHNFNKELPDVTKREIDLFAAETGALLSWIYYLLESELDAESELIRQRIKHEVTERIINPYLARDDYGWMGFNLEPGSMLSNWTTWINSNCLTAFLLVESEQEKRFTGIDKILSSVDVFLGGYHTDGGCDEGPGYWGRAGGSLFDLLEQLYRATDKQFSVYNQSLILSIGSYIYKVNIDQDYFVNFADASVKTLIDAPVVYLYGKRIGDKRLASLGAKAYREQGSLGLINPEILSLFRVLLGLFSSAEMNEYPLVSTYLQDVWLDHTQVMVAREQHDSAQGFYLAAKGGHNSESHNHNDVGSFILFYQGQPVFIDVGVETYTAKTFSKDRYEIWTMQSAYHNLPTIGEFQQQVGRMYCAADLYYRAEPDYVHFALDLRKTYPKQTQILAWERGYIFYRTDNPHIVIFDDFQLITPQTITLTFMLANKASVSKPGIISLISDLQLRYDEQMFSVEVEPISITDRRLSQAWGNKIYRLLLITKQPVKQRDWQIFVEKSI